MGAYPGWASIFYVEMGEITVIDELHKEPLYSPKAKHRRPLGEIDGGC